MANELDPQVGQWYRHLDKGQRFNVVAIDDRTDTVEVQHIDGNREEFSFEEWRDMDIAPGAEPGNWIGPMDSENRDVEGNVTNTSDADWDAVYREHHLQSATEPDNQEQSGLRDDFGEVPPSREVPLEGNAQANARQRTGNLHERGDGVYEEVFDGTWSAEYLQDEESGKWRVNVYREDASEWRNIGLDSLEQARQVALDYFRLGKR